MATASSLCVSYPHVLQQGRTPELGIRRGASILQLSALGAAPAIRLRSSGVKGIRVAATAQLESGEATDETRGDIGGLSKNWSVSAELQKIVGEKELPRPQVVKRLWQYIHEHNLQDPNNKRMILCNAELSEVLGVKQTDMFALQRLLSNHLTYLGTRGSSAKPKKRRIPKKTPQKFAQVPGFKVSCGYRISDALKSFLGTEETHMDHNEAYSKIWQYVTANNLKDPSDKRRVNCDAKLSKLLGCESFVGLGLRKYLAAHITKEEDSEE